MAAGDAVDDPKIHRAAFIIAILTAIAASGGCGYTVWKIAVDQRFWDEILFKHFAAVIGLPGAAGGAFALVVFLRQTEGPIEFVGLGFTVKGAAGQLVMWILCFLSFVAGLKLLWDL